MGLIAATTVPLPALQTPSSDQELVADIAARLGRDADLRDAPISVEVEAGRA